MAMSVGSRGNRTHLVCNELRIVEQNHGQMGKSEITDRTDSADLSKNLVIL